MPYAPLTSAAVLGDVTEADVTDVKTLARMLTELRRNQQRLAQRADASPISGAVVVAAVTFSGVAIDVDHKLGRKWSGFALANKSTGAVDAYASHQDDALDARVIHLVPTAVNGTADVWVW